MMKIKIKKESIFPFWQQVFYLLLFLWITGIFLLPNNVFASPITPQKLIELINQERAKYELNSLSENILLTKAAKQKAEDILKQQKFAHNFSERKFSQWIKDQGYQYSIVGENLAINFITSKGIFNAWLASPSHKQNILYEDYQEIGIAVVKGKFAEENTTIAVALFAAPAVAAEQITALNINNTLSSSFLENKGQGPSYSYYNASNLSENYITNIATNKLNKIYFNSEPIELTTFSIDKNKIAKYLNWLFKFTILYIAVMLLTILIFQYTIYFQKLIKKLRTLSYPTFKRKKENLTFSENFIVRIK